MEAAYYKQTVCKVGGGAARTESSSASVKARARSEEGPEQFEAERSTYAGRIVSLIITMQSSHARPELSITRIAQRADATVVPVSGG